MSHGKETAYFEERLRAVDRDNTFRMGTLAQQVKADFTNVRVRLEALEGRLEQLEQRLVALEDPGSQLR